MGQVVATDRLLSGRYRIDEPLGVGGMARVWRGQDLRLRRPVAIKELAGPWLSDHTAISRFHREALIAARLAHPNIVSLYDAGGDAGGRYLVMELVEGHTVARMLAAGPMPVDQVVSIAVQTCDGLAAAHAAGVIHRDIKPANVMVTRSGVVKICDFGIAKAALDSADTGLTGPMYAMGTSKFMAPEQPRGRIDARTDLYALGCTIYAMLTGDAPFDGRDTAEILRKHRDESPLPLREHRADVGAALDALVSQLLAKSPDARPASAAEVRARLKALQDHVAVSARRRAPAAIAVPTGAVSRALPATRPSARRVSAHVAARRRGDRFTPGLVVRGLAAAGVLAVATTVGVFVASGARSALLDPAQPRILWGAPAVSPATAVTPTPGPEVSDAPGPPPPTQGIASTSVAPQSDPIATLRLSIQRQVATGQLNPDKASDLYKKVDDIAQAINEDNYDDARHKIQDFRNRIAALLGEGQLTAAGHDALARDLDAIPLP